MSSAIQSGPEHGSVVATHGLTKRYGNLMALDSVDVRVPNGAVYVMVGANGAGKSTTLEVLMNLKRADSGRAEVLGLDTAEQGPLVRAQVGYLPEPRGATYGWLSCRRLLRHVATYYPSWDPAYADHLCRAFDLRLERRVRAMSRGEARRLQLVLALAHRPPLLLLDEPTDGLDPVVRARTLALLAEHLADSAATTVVIATHQIREVESLADHVGVLRAGRLVTQLPRETLQRTVRRYRIAVPDDWEPPSGLQVAGRRRFGGGREAQWTLVGEERDVSQRLSQAGAQVREVTSLTLEDATLALLSEEVFQ